MLLNDIEKNKRPAPRVELLGALQRRVAEGAVGDAQADQAILHLRWESGCSEDSRLQATPGIG